MIQSPCGKKIISCEFCRKRKLRCSRDRPICLNCAKYNQLCSYDRLDEGKAPVATRDHPRIRKTAELRARIANLEALVKQNTPVRPIATVADGRVELLVDHDLSIVASQSQEIPGKSEYVPPIHWTALAQELDSLKQAVENYDEQAFVNVSNETGSRQQEPLLIGILGAPCATLDVILDNIPPRAVCDRLLNIYFNAWRDPSVLIFHPVSFQRQYLSFWAAPKSASPTFIATLLLICVLALGLSQRSEDSQNFVQGVDSTSITRWRDMAVAAITLSGCTTTRRPPRYSCEALILLSTSMFYTESQDLLLVCHLVSTVVRVAVQAGYHRDARNYTRLSLFQGEMQRRLWGYVMVLDVNLAFQSGLPRIVRENDYDTELPSNISNADFDEDSTALPLSRLENETTPLFGLITKTRMVQMFGIILDAANSTQRIGYDAIFDLDAQLLRLFSSLPASFHMLTPEHRLLDTTDSRATRYHFELQYLRARCVLHRRSLSMGYRTELRATTSRQICVDAALQILHYLVEAHAEIQPGGLLYRDRWIVIFVLLGEHLFASMIICHELYVLRQEESRIMPGSEKDTRLIQTLTEALEKTYQVLQDWGNYSGEAAKVAKVLAMTLTKPSKPAQKGQGKERAQSSIEHPPVTFDSAANHFFSLDGASWDSTLEEFLTMPIMDNLDIWNFDAEMLDTWTYNR